MVSVFTSTIMGVMSRFIPNKIVTCNDKDPPWITLEIKWQLNVNIVYTTHMSDEGVDLMNGIMYGLFKMIPQK